MVDTSSMPLGSVTVEVKASLSKLVSDFAAARVQSQAFANDMSRAVAPTNATAAATANLAKQFNGVANQYEPLRAIQQRYAADLAVVNGAEAAGIVASTEATALRGRMASSFAVLEEETSKSGKSLSGWAREVEHNVRAMRLLIGFVGVDLAVRFGEFAVKTLEATAAIKGQAEALGLTTDQLQEYRVVAGQVGMSAADMDKGLETFRKNLDDMAAGRVSTFSKMLKIMGVDIHDAGGAVKPTNQLFLEMVDSLNRVGNTAQQRAGAVVAFGEAGNRMGELIQQGSSGVEKLMEAAKALGLVISADQIQQADVTAKKLDTLWQVLKIDFSKTVVDNAQSIQQIATALEGLASGAIGNAVKSIGELIQRFEDLGTAVRQALGLLSSLDMDKGSTGRGAGLLQRFGEINYDYRTGAISGTDAYGNYYTTKAPPSSTKGLGKVAGGMGADGSPSNTVSLSEATRDPPKAKGPNIDLSHLLSQKGKGAPKAKFDQFEKEMDAEMAEYLQLQEAATGDIEEQNRLAKEVIDLKVKEKDEDIKRQVKHGELTAKEAQQLIHQNAINAAAEKEAEDRKTELERIQLQAKYADEIVKLEEDRLNTERELARTNDKRKEIDAEILQSKQLQAVSALQEQIDEATVKNDTVRLAQLTDELTKLRANQLEEWKAFDLQHLNPMQQFQNDLPKNPAEFKDATQAEAFKEFNQKLSDAGQFANDLGSDFGKAAGALAQLQNPLTVFKNLISDLASTFTKNFIEKPVSDWIANKLGQPLAKQGFGGDLDKLSKAAGGTALTTTQMNTALATATGSLTALTAAANAAASALAASAATGGGGGGGMGGLASLLGGGGGGGGIGDLFGGAGGASTIFGASGLGDSFDVSGFGLSDMFGASDILDMGSMGIGFSGGGFTGEGPPNKTAGLVHAGEYVWDAQTTKQFMPLLAMIGSGRLPSFQGPGMGQTKGRGENAQPQVIQFGDVHLHGVADERTARQSANQFIGHVQQRSAQVARKGLNK